MKNKNKKESKFLFVKINISLIISWLSVKKIFVNEKIVPSVLVFLQNLHLITTGTSDNLGYFLNDPNKIIPLAV